MADKTHKIKITNDGENSDDIIDVTPVFDDDDLDEDDARAPIDLDAPVEVPSTGASATVDLSPEAEAALESGLPPAAGNNLLVQDLKRQVAQANDNYMRALADLQNFRRRGEEERGRILRDGNERLIKELLPVLDDFDLAVNAAKQAQSYEQLIGGVEAILRKFNETLTKQGVMQIESVGTKFDPDVHEAVMLDEDSEEEDETVTAELRKGYTFNNRVIRPALVKVAKSL